MPVNRNLGRKLSRPAPRICPSCGAIKPAGAFRVSRRKSSLDIVCAECRKTKKGAATRICFLPRSDQDIARRRIRRNAWPFLCALAKRRIQHKGGDDVEANEYAKRLARLPDRIAAIVGKTYAEMGDAAELADDEALMMIRDLLMELDDTLIERNRHKRLARRC